MNLEKVISEVEKQTGLKAKVSRLDMDGLYFKYFKKVQFYTNTKFEAFCKVFASEDGYNWQLCSSHNDLLNELIFNLSK